MRLDVQVYQGLLERDTALVINVTGGQGDTMDVLVENMGRVNFGSKINDHKVSKQRLRLSMSSDWECLGGGGFVVFFSSHHSLNCICIKGPREQPDSG